MYPDLQVCTSMYLSANIHIPAYTSIYLHIPLHTVIYFRNSVQVHTSIYLRTFSIKSIYKYILVYTFRNFRRKYILVYTFYEVFIP